MEEETFLCRHLFSLRQSSNTSGSALGLSKTLAVAATYNTVMEAEIGRTMLADAGIWASIRNEYMSAIYPTGIMPAQLVVYGEDLEKAQALLQRK